MAKLIKKETSMATFECYSERGILSYFMFRFLPHSQNIYWFLSRLHFPKETPVVLPTSGVENLTIFSELSFGQEGFGLPDGAIYFEHEGKASMIFLEGKTNETYAKSCKGKSFNSTIKGQLELRWRMVSLYKSHYSEAVSFKKGIDYLQEIGSYVDHYSHRDPYYGKPRRDPRRVRLIEGVKKVFNYIDKCPMNRILFLIISRDKEHPFNCIPEDLLPDCFDEKPEVAKHSFCWMDARDLEECAPV